MFNIESLIITTGYLGIFFIVFAESGLFFGFFLPGDSLLITAGLLASRGYLNIVVLILVSALGAILGDSIGFWFGKKTGPKIFNKEDSLLFHKRNLLKANEFYKKHGGKTIVLARFMPFIRTFAPIVAGAGEMDYANFLKFNIFGGLFWVLLTTLSGFFLGRIIPDIDKYIIFIISGIIIVSALPTMLHLYKEYHQVILLKIKTKFFRIP